MKFPPAGISLATLVLCACVHSPARVGAAPEPAKDNTMTTTVTTGEAGQDAAPLQPKLNADQVLLRLLQLVRGTERVEEFTQQRLSQVMGVDFVSHESNRYGFGEQLTPDWWYGIEMRSIGRGYRFQFSFNSRPGATPPMTDICQLDFDRFTSELEAMGFKRQRYHGEHGRFIHDWFERGPMRIEVYPEGERIWTPENGSGRTCVKMVLIP